MTNNNEFQLLNPSNQLALFSTCIENCSPILKTTWIIYQGLMNSSLSIIEWSVFNQAIIDRNDWLFGKCVYELIGYVYLSF